MKARLFLEVEALRFSYQGQEVPLFQDFYLSIPQGSFLGVIGPNGAGKTTLIHLLAGLLRPEKGSITLWKGAESFTPEAFKPHMGFVPQDTALYPSLSPLENLRYFAAAYGLGRAEAKRRALKILEEFGLGPMVHKPLKALSGGMKKRVNLAAALIHRPLLVFLDEPTAGIDVHSRKIVNDYLLRLHREGTTLIYTSHHLRETEQLCARIIILDHGRILVDDTPLGLRQRFGPQSNLEDIFLKLTAFPSV
ncbi:MAG: ABC transporter ATP-binding protein [Flavobacteriales bacterium]|nr:ABC transporter ATP-binding protein [Flavobacteriales bacterium]MCX7768551.1 ABC transporter ATP-binding protein [Flavobacteriales bacterium]MDW8409480.1 ABC transporter ATP-binding protein [Flavobacteriales bacterium]